MEFSRKNYFNLVEVALAIGILAIGVTAVLALFPVGFDKSKQAVGENYCTEASDSLFSYVSRRANEDIGNWQTFFGATGGDAPLIPATKPSTEVNSTSGWTQTGGGGDMNDIYFIDPPVDGVYGIQVSTGNVVDFTGQGLLWQEELPKLEVSGTSISIDTGIAVGINLEISWPIEKPYAQRKKNYYYFELYNTNS